MPQKCRFRFRGVVLYSRSRTVLGDLHGHIHVEVRQILQYVTAEWKPAFLRQAREFLFFPLLPREASKCVSIFDRETGSKPERLRSGFLQADLSLIVWNDPPARVSAQAPRFFVIYDSQFPLASSRFPNTLSGPPGPKQVSSHFSEGN